MSIYFGALQPRTHENADPGQVIKQYVSAENNAYSCESAEAVPKGRPTSHPSRNHNPNWSTEAGAGDMGGKQLTNMAGQDMHTNPRTHPEPTETNALELDNPAEISKSTGQG